MKRFSRVGISRVLFFLIVPFLEYFGFASVGKAWEAYQLKQEEKRLRQEIEELQTYNAALQTQKKYAQSEAFIEYEARQMGMIKPGETAVIVVTPPEAEENVDRAASPDKQVEVLLPNWRRWWNLFFGESEGGAGGVSSGG